MIVCPYCEIDLAELPDHDLLACMLKQEDRKKSQVEALEKLYALQDPRREETC